MNTHDDVSHARFMRRQRMHSLQEPLRQLDDALQSIFYHPHFSVQRFSAAQRNGPLVQYLIGDLNELMSKPPAGGKLSEDMDTFFPDYDVHLRSITDLIVLASTSRSHVDRLDAVLGGLLGRRHIEQPVVWLKRYAAVLSRCIAFNSNCLWTCLQGQRVGVHVEVGLLRGH
jgi:hypothetical protein